MGLSVAVQDYLCMYAGGMQKKKSKVSTLVRLSVAEEGDLFMYAGAGKKFSKRKTKKSSLGDFIFVQHVY